MVLFEGGVVGSFCSVEGIEEGFLIVLLLIIKWRMLLSFLKMVEVFMLCRVMF